MELLEMIGWIVLGFISTYGVLEVVNRKPNAVTFSNGTMEKGVIKK
jgi:hypothetical protein